MRRGWIESFKPAAPARVHLVLAALMWSTVGAALLAAGGWWTTRVWRAPTPWLLALAASAGLAKARWVLDRSARRIADRIEERGDGRCLGGFLSLRSWLLVAAMAGAGRALRSGIVARHAVGLLYVAVGSALLVSSRLLWVRWRRHTPRQV